MTKEELIKTMKRNNNIEIKQGRREGETKYILQTSDDFQVVFRMINDRVMSIFCNKIVLVEEVEDICYLDLYVGDYLILSLGYTLLDSVKEIYEN